MTTEITDTNVTRPKGWVLFDATCSLCSASARFFSPTLDRHGFALAPHQTPWVRARLGLSDKEPPAEMRVLLANGDAPGGADAILEITRRIWWAWPLFIFAKLPGVKPMLRAVYRIIAANRNCTNGACKIERRLRWFDWLQLLVLPAVSVAFQNAMGRWVFMWAIAAGIFFGCKWLTWRKAQLTCLRPSVARSLAYSFAWPGMEAAEFLGKKRTDTLEPSKTQWLFAAAKTLAGVAIISFAARGAFSGPPLLTGWIGMVGIISLLHFGLFELLALAWQTFGVNAKPVMRRPLLATSLAEFWSTRWNTAFNVLAHDFAFRPLCRKFGAHGATLGVFLISGIVHDLVISLPARAGYGLPTAYFLFQGVAVLAERTVLGRRFGLGKGFRGWLFTLVCAGAPAFWLFHPQFVINVILPMLHAIGAN